MSSQDINYNNLYFIKKGTKPYNKDFFLDAIKTRPNIKGIKYVPNGIEYDSNTPIIFHTNYEYYQLGIIHSVNLEHRTYNRVEFDGVNGSYIHTYEINNIRIIMRRINLETNCLEAKPIVIKMEEGNFAYIGEDQITVRDNSVLTNICRYLGVHSSATQAVNNKFSRAIPVQTFTDQVKERKAKNDKIRNAQRATRKKANHRARKRAFTQKAEEKRKQNLLKKQAATLKKVRNSSVPSIYNFRETLRLPNKPSYYNSLNENELNLTPSKSKSKSKGKSKKRKRNNSNYNNNNNNSNSNSNNYYGNFSMAYDDHRLPAEERRIRRNQMLKNTNFNNEVGDATCDSRALQLEEKIIERINEIKEQKGDGYQLHSSLEYPKRVKTVGVINVSKYKKEPKKTRPIYNNIRPGTDLLCLISLDDEENEINMIVEEYIKREANMRRVQKEITPKDQYELLHGTLRHLILTRKIGIRRYFENKTLKPNTRGPGRSLK